MTQRKYQPGRKPQFTDGRISEARVAWARVGNRQWIIYSHDDSLFDGVEKEEIGPNIMLQLPGARRAINLSAWTEAEVDALEKLFNLLFSMVRPVVQLRDKEAEDAFATSGDDSFARLYRQVPQLVIRERQVGEHFEGVLLGFADSPQGDRGAGDSDGGVRGDRDELAPGEPEEIIGEDDREEADEPEGFC